MFLHPMRFGHLLLFLTSFALAFGAAPVKKPQARTGSSAKAAGGKRSSGRSVARRGARPLVKAPAYARQQQPSTDRYREIQQALVDKGFLKAEANGVWGPESVEALKQYQAQANLPITGKLNSRTLIGLGLGPRIESTTRPPEETAPPLAEANNPAQR
jgi:peptidoglycan hydrolase-like protein with peptidoglycan-binding domain